MVVDDEVVTVPFAFLIASIDDSTIYAEPTSSPTKPPNLSELLLQTFVFPTPSHTIVQSALEW